MRTLLVFPVVIALGIAPVALCTEDTAPLEGNSDAVRAWIDTCHAAPILFWGSQGHLAMVVSNRSPKPVDVKARLEIESFDGTVAETTFELHIPANGFTRQEIPPEVLGDLGIKWVRYRLGVDGRQGREEETAFAYMRPAGPTDGKADGVLFGIAYGASSDNWSDGAAYLSAVCGAKIARDDIPWSWTQPQEDVWNWEVVDLILSSHERYGIEIQPLIGGAPKWAQKPPQPGMDARNRPPTDKAWRNWVSALAKRYNGHVRYWEIWNEPDIQFFNGTTEEYLQVLKAAYEELKVVNPEYHVLTGGFASMFHHRGKPGMIETVVRDGNQWFDIFAYHRHGFFPEFQREIDQHVLPLLERYLPGPPRIYFTETAQDTRVSQRNQACTLVKKATFAWSRGAVAYTWFNLYDHARAPTPSTPGVTFGLFTKDRLPKASYAAATALNRALAGKHFVRQIEAGPDCWVLLFGDDEERALVFWHENAHTAPPHLVLRTNSDNVTAQDIMGNRSPADGVKGRVVLQTADTPGYLLLSVSDKEPEIEGELLAATGRYLAIPGRTQRLEVDIWNPFDEEREYQFRWFVPSPLGERQYGDAVRLAAGARQRVKLDLAVSKMLQGRYGDIHTVELYYQIAGTSWSGNLFIPMLLGSVLVQRGDYPEEPAFTLDRQDQVVNLAEHDPHSAHLLWTGSRDLSAKVWVAWTGEALKVRVAVRDDLFSQNGVTEHLCEGDSVHLALTIPEQEGLWQLDVADVAEQGVIEVASTSPGRDIAASHLQLMVERDSSNRTYEVVLPAAAFGLSDKVLAQGIRFNVRVNDDDGQGHESWLEPAPDAGRKLDPEYFPLLVLKP